MWVGKPSTYRGGLCVESLMVLRKGEDCANSVDEHVEFAYQFRMLPNTQ
jgi:hypothetical protein